MLAYISVEFELQIAEKLARQAGKRALELQHLGVAYYKDNFEGPVTAGDIEADQIISEGLRAHFPQDLIISEETYHPGIEIPASGRIWFVDPIDGTQDYAAGGKEWAVMIGLSLDAKAVLGVVFDPSTQTLWRGYGSLAERVEADGSVHRLDIRNQLVDPAGLKVVMSHKIPHRPNPAILKIFQKSSVGLKVTMVSDGIVDAYVSSGRNIKLWDTCAPAAILSASGGVFQTIQGHDLLFSGSIKHGIEISATTPHANQGVIETWITLRKIRRS